MIQASTVFVIVMLTVASRCQQLRLAKQETMTKVFATCQRLVENIRVSLEYNPIANGEFYFIRINTFIIISPVVAASIPPDATSLVSREQ